MIVHTDSERVRTSRRMVLEFLASSVDMSLTAPEVRRWMEQYGADPERYGAAAPAHAAGERDAARPGEHYAGDSEVAETVAQPVKYDNDSYVRDYSRCILCYKCVEACGEVAQNTFAIAVAGRVRGPHLHRVRRRPARLGLRVLRQLHRRLPDRRTDVRQRVQPAAGRRMDESKQTVTTTICPYCGVGCNLER